jgi:nucleoside-diphosphate-sugar epimerase
VSRKALVLGGCGFIGSHIVRKFLAAGDSVVVVDGMMPRSGSNVMHLSTTLHNLTVIAEAVDQAESLSMHVSNSDIIIDCMGWTAHRLGQQDPHYDLELNAGSHLYLIECLRQDGPDVIYLGSRSQYGRTSQAVVDESDCMEPVDVQGIHKLAAESYYRIFSDHHGFNAISLRIANTFGPNQPVHGDDIGLIGGIIKSSVRDDVVEIFGVGRTKQFIFVTDLADIVYRLSTRVNRGFTAYNVGGPVLELAALADKVIRLAGKGRLQVSEMPLHIAQIDTGDVVLNVGRLESQLGRLRFCELDDALQQTVSYFEQQLNGNVAQ